MKKIIKGVVAILCVAMLISMIGCGKGNTSSEDMKSEKGDDGILIGVDGDDITENGNGNGKDSKGGSTGGSGAGKTVSEPVKMSGKDPFANVPSYLKGTTVKFAVWGDEGGTEYKKVYNAFTKKTGIKVELVTYNQEQYNSTIATHITNKMGPDVIIQNNTLVTSFEVAQPLNGILDLNDSFWTKQSIKDSTINGNTYFVNSSKSVWQDIGMVFYNKKIFSTNGLTTPTDYYKQGQWSYENLYKCMQQVKKLGLKGGCIDADILATQMGTPPVSYDPDTKTFKNNLTSTAFAWQLYNQSVKEGLWVTSDWWGTFGNGDIGLYVSGRYGAVYNGYFKDMDDESLAAVPLPSTYQGKALKTTNSRSYGIAKGAKNPEGAAYFLRWFLDYDYYKSAGCNAFKNKTLEKVFFDDVVPDAQKRGYVTNYKNTVFNAVGQGLPGISAEIKDVDAAQVPNVLASFNNQYQNAVNTANSRVQAIK